MGISGHKRIVVKVGTSSLTYGSGGLNLKKIDKLSWVLTDLRNRGLEVVLVSSGAIAVGSERLGLQKRPRDILGKQAASAVGQAILMQIYSGFFMSYNQKVAQILLTRDVMENEKLKSNARNTINTLFSMGIIPIVNENDTVSTDELGFSENDALSAYVACLVDSDMLIMLSDSDGFYDSDPKKNPGARLIPVVESITDIMENSAEGPSTDLGTGGMITKINAAKMASASGIDTVVISGEDPSTIFSVLEGEQVGTIFLRK